MCRAFGPRLLRLPLGAPAPLLQALVSPAAEEVQAAVEQHGGDDEEQHAAGEPDAQSQLFLGAACRRWVSFQRVENSALVAGGVCRLAGHAHDVRREGSQVFNNKGGASGGHPLFPLEALSGVAGQHAVPVRVVHDAVKAVDTASHFWPNYHCCVSCDVLDGYSHRDDFWEIFFSLGADLPVEWEDVVWILIVVLCNVGMEFVRKVCSHLWHCSVKMGMKVHKVWSVLKCVFLFQVKV